MEHQLLVSRKDRFRAEGIRARAATGVAYESEVCLFLKRRSATHTITSDLTHGLSRWRCFQLWLSFAVLIDLAVVYAERRWRWQGNRGRLGVLSENWNRQITRRTDAVGLKGFRSRSCAQNIR